MSFLIWPGAALSFLGLCGIFWCIFRAMKARNAGLEDDELRARLQKIVAVNLGALGVSALGLMLVVIGIILG
ncbi:hypothetical protein [Halocynthiibacter styelae]|uniref:Uncharacterized protein n=1 Tax=Halocynthiibacter styelae TaxID=2761955 RepID=A0A8J7IDY3_9RHOB|nr:hypothetical protein [Paenihalocynthiibacter styelae]MBI1494249.1 hypothetical protein [Paenihalocynthiibacter styelae]